MRRAAFAVPLAMLAAGALAGCTPTVALEPAPEATDPGCAGVVVRLPASIGDQERRITDAQGTAAWGEPASVTLVCGIEPVAVSELPCFDIEGVSWLRENRRIAAGRRVVLTTYGRIPALQVVVDPAVTSVSDVLPLVSGPVVEATTGTDRTCVAPEDLTQGPAAGAG